MAEPELTPDAPVVADDPAPDAPATPAAPAPVKPSSIAAAKPADAPAEGVDPVEKPEGVEETADEGDWRAEMAGEDKDLLKLAKRFGSKSGVLRALADARKTIGKGQGAVLDALPEDATDEQKAEWRKARGVPDKPDAYDTKIEGIEWDENDRKDVSSFTERMHALNAPASLVKEALQHFADVQTARAQDLAVAATNFRKDTEQALKREYGRDYDRNVELMRDFGVGQLGEGDWDAFTNTPLADGTLLGDNPKFIKLIVDSALDRGDGSPFLTGGGAGGVSDGDLIKAHAELTAKASGGGAEAKAARRQMNDPEYEAKINAAYERKTRRESKAA